MRNILFYSIFILMTGCTNCSKSDVSSEIKIEPIVEDIKEEKIPEELVYKPTPQVKEKENEAKEVKENQKNRSKYNLPCDKLILEVEKIINSIIKNPNEKNPAWTQLSELNNDPFHNECVKSSEKYRDNYDALSNKLPE